MRNCHYLAWIHMALWSNTNVTFPSFVSLRLKYFKKTTTSRHKRITFRINVTHRITIVVCPSFCCHKQTITMTGQPSICQIRSLWRDQNFLISHQLEQAYVCQIPLMWCFYLSFCYWGYLATCQTSSFTVWEDRATEDVIPCMLFLQSHFLPPT